MEGILNKIFSLFKKTATDKFIFLPIRKVYNKEHKLITTIEETILKNANGITHYKRNKLTELNPLNSMNIDSLYKTITPDGTLTLSALTKDGKFLDAAKLKAHIKSYKKAVPSRNNLHSPYKYTL